MKKKRPSKLSLHRETLQQLDPSYLHTLAGGDTAGVACAPTFHGTCKGTCQTCGSPTCFETICTNCCTTDTL
jgi:hypothetical protein